MLHDREWMVSWYEARRKSKYSAEVRWVFRTKMFIIYEDAISFYKQKKEKESLQQGFDMVKFWACNEDTPKEDEKNEC